jgi:precorrin-6Y C5,15-methyltransferase (decarboxylating)
LAWEETRAVSLHGRDSLLPLARSLASGDPVFVLADPGTTAHGLAAWMLERGLGAFRMHMMENLYSTPDGEIRAARKWSLDLAEAAGREEPAGSSSGQRVLYLEPWPEGRAGEAQARKSWPFGLTDAALAKERGLLTKAPVRAAALAALGIEAGHCVWDLGAGSGAVSLEAARLAWRGRVYAVERDANRLELIRENRRTYGAANLEIVAGTMPSCLPSYPGHGEADARAVQERRPADVPGIREPVLGEAALPRPQRIFVGGGLGGAPDAAALLLSKAWGALLPGGKLVAACVLLSSLERCRAILTGLGAAMGVTCLQASSSVPLARDMRLAASDPVFLVTGEKGWRIISKEGERS